MFKDDLYLVSKYDYNVMTTTSGTGIETLRHDFVTIAASYVSVSTQYYQPATSEGVTGWSNIYVGISVMVIIALITIGVIFTRQHGKFNLTGHDISVTRPTLRHWSNVRARVDASMEQIFPSSKNGDNTNCGNLVLNDFVIGHLPHSVVGVVRWCIGPMVNIHTKISIWEIYQYLIVFTITIDVASSSRS
jgi:hypothetical protein